MEDMRAKLFFFFFNGYGQISTLEQGQVAERAA